MSIKINKIAFIAAWVVMILAGCTTQPLAVPDGGELDYSELVPVSLGSVSVTADEAATRANTPLADGQKFRLYAFPKGVTDYSKQITSYSYTMRGGSPVIDPGQGADALYLPYGEVDIYMVSPSAVQIGEDVVPDNPDTPEDESATNPIYNEIATKNGITVPLGVDFLASKTGVTIKRGESNTINPAVLTHKMAQVQVRVKALTDATYNTLKLISVNVDGQTDAPQPFILGAGGGSIAAVEAGTAQVTLDNITEVTAGAEYTATAVVFPRKASKMKVEIMFLADLKVAEGEEPRQETYLMSGVLSDLALEGGKRNALKTEPRTSLEIIWRPEVLPWDNKPVSTMPLGDVVFYFDGNDAPEMIDGKLSWRDRSGSGNHAVLEGNVTYDAANKCYNLSAKTDLLRLPALGYIPEYTLELVTTSGSVNNDMAVNFKESSAAVRREIGIYLPYKDHITYFDAPSSSDRITYCFDTDSETPVEAQKDVMYYHTFRTYHFSKSNVTKKGSMGVNGVEKKVVNNIATPHVAFNVNQLGGAGAIRLRSARLYRKVLTPTQLKSNYDADQATYRQQSDIVRDASLLLELDGKVPPYSDGTNTYWPDMSGNKNHAKYIHIGGTNHVVYTGTGYRFNNINSDNQSYTDLIKPLGNFQTYTLEVLATSHKNATIFFSTNVRASNNRSINIHFPWNNQLYFDSPYSSKGRMIYRGPLTSAEYLSVNTTYVVFTRQYAAGADDNLMKIIINGVHKASFVPEEATTALTYTNIPLSDCFIGEIKTVRLYNRVLTDAEIQKNRNADKVRYKL